MVERGDERDRSPRLSGEGAENPKPWLGAKGEQPATARAEPEEKESESLARSSLISSTWNV
jgi:hypothetical protein